MMKKLFPVAAVLVAVGAGRGMAQGIPTSQPPYILIAREYVKLGHGAEHARIEAGWPAAFAKAKSPTYYLAMVSLTGPSEAWFVTPYASHAAIADDMKQAASDTVLGAELQRLSRADAEMLTDARQIEAVARPDLSSGAYPNIGRQRFWEISVYRVRPGHEASFDAAAKAYGASAQRTAPGLSFRVYQVLAGMPEPTYLVFQSFVTYAQVDTAMAAGQKIMGGFTPDEQAAVGKFLTDGLLTVETNRFQLNATMSYVSDSVRATDPSFWKPKPRTRRP
jgi:hypothetical protein